MKKLPIQKYNTSTTQVGAGRQYRTLVAMHPVGEVTYKNLISNI
jgi:hypothetical protein